MLVRTYKDMEAILAFLLLFTLAADCRPTVSGGPMKVQKPFNLMKESYNFNTTLYWDYNITSIRPYFQVEYRFYKNDVWTIVKTCGNISRNHCDLSEEIVDPYVHYAVRVKAFVGSEMSEYAQTEFYLINDGIIGPPTLNASDDGKYIHVDVWYPLVGDKKNVGNYLDDLTYDIYYGNEKEETDECDHFGCSVKILITNQTKYCFSAQGKSDSFPMTIEKSKEICVKVNAKNGTPNKLYVTIVCIVVVVIILLPLSFFIIRRRLQANSMLPMSLNSIAKVVTSQMNMPSAEMTKYDQVSIYPVDSSEEKMTPEEAEKDLNVSDDSDIRDISDHGYKSSVGETEQKAGEEKSGNEEPSSRDYYHTENSDSSIVCMTEANVPKQEPLRDITPVTNSYGYDKPHCPL